MANSNNYDFGDPLILLTPGTVEQTLNSSSTIDFNNAATTPDGLNPSNSSILSSPPRSIAESDNIVIPELENIVGYVGFPLSVSNTDLSPSALVVPSIQTALNECPNEILDIIAQPKASYRGRYPSEIDKLKNRAKRFIRAENKDRKHEYPTIKIPSWCHSNQQLYIRVTLVTVISDKVPYHCIHPYEIDTPDNNIIKDSANNSLYFCINENEFNTGEKSFRIIVIKKKQDELKSYGPMRLLDYDRYESVNIENPQDAKQKILLYQLWKSQFVFTIAERQDNNCILVPILHTSVKSQIMVDEATDARHPTINHFNCIGINQIKCIPQKGDWQGGDEVLIIMPTPIKQKVYQISFDFGEYGQQLVNEISQIDTKIILFRTLPCPLRQSINNFKAWINILENNILIQQIDFIYLTSKIVTQNICPICQIMSTDFNINNKRPCQYYEDFQCDSGDVLVSQMNQLSMEPTTRESRHRSSSSTSIDEKENKFDKYINRLKVAVESFVRTNDPSRLFRRTRVLLSNFDKNSSPLNETIQHGHIQLALSVIEQIIDMPSPNRLLEKINENDETPLLIAAKLNEWKLIEVILKNRSDLASQKDKDGNNLLHLLANLNEDKGAETIENILKILPNESKMSLLKEKNNQSQTPMEIAQSHGNTSCLELLIDVEKTF